MLDVLEAFLNFHGHIYLRLDGTTKVEQRQILMERFNSDPRIFVFILSTRSGGVGVNLTGADTVVFYDSDWNPTMDAQAQDRCHRIGQTRDVHIYRLVSEKTIEENILKKANQKRMLGDLAIEGGNFTTAYFKSVSTVLHHTSLLRTCYSCYQLPFLSEYILIWQMLSRRLQSKTCLLWEARRKHLAAWKWKKSQRPLAPLGGNLHRLR